jgi:hypothetical protein
MIPRRYPSPLLALALLASLPTLANAQEDKDKGAARDRIEGMITKIEPLGEEGSGRYRLTINTGALWRDYVRNVASEDGKVAEKSVAEGQPETESSVVRVEIGPKTPIQHRFRAEDDERSLGASSAEGAFEISKEDVEKAGANDIPDGKQGKSLQPHSLKADQYVIIKAKAQGDNPTVDWVVRLEPVRRSKGQ